ncbi:MAG: ABC transporter permease, partial [Akkermansiaceae bacterium]
MLALRYLNPKRTHLSPITLTSLLGVAVGVMVLIVVLAVMAGFEREVKSRLLGFAPHVELEYKPDGPDEAPVLIHDWREITKLVEKVDEVQEAYAQLRDFTILEMADMFYPVEYRAIDTSNERQMEALEDLIDKEKYDGGTAAMGLDEKAVVAETTAKQFRLRVGDVIMLHSARNLQQLAKAWKITDRELVAVEYAAMFAEIRKDLRTKMTVEETREGFDFEDLKKIYYAIDGLQRENIRPAERLILTGILTVLDSGEKNATEDRRLLPPGSVAKV